MSVGQTKRKEVSGWIPPVTLKDRFIKFIKDDFSFKAENQIKSLLRRRELTKNCDLYNEKIKEVFLHELKKHHF